MQRDELYVQGLGRYLPPRIELSSRIADYPSEEIERVRATGLTHVAEEEELYPAAMALHAAREAMTRANASADELGVIAVTAIHRHGHRNLWSMASHLQQTLGARSALPFNVQQGCNANLIAVQLAVAHLQANPSAIRALIVASDRFAGSSFDRFTSDYGVLYGDAATALVLGRAPSTLQICGVATESVPEAETMHRDLHESVQVSTSHYDVRETKRRFLAENGKETFARLCQDALLRIKKRLLPEHAERELAHIVFPNLARDVLEANYYPVFHDAERKSLWDFGRTVGHLGTADAAAGLYELCVARELAPGRKVLALGAGAGFTLSGMLLESRA